MKTPPPTSPATTWTTHLSRPTGLILLAGVLIVLTVRAAAPVTSADTYFHLRLGQEFLDGWSPRSPQSVTQFATADWLPSQWLGQIALAGASSHLGLPGVAWLTGLLLLTFAAVLYVTLRTRVGPLSSALLIAAVVTASFPALSGRPQVLSYAFTALFVSAWLNAQRSGRVPWHLLLLAWLWPLVHGMWVLGIVISAVAVVGLLATDRATARKPWPWLALPVLSVAVAALTPVGPALYTAVVRVGSISQHFAEWAPPDFTRPTTAVAGLLVGALVIGLVRNSQASWFTVSLTLLTCAFLAWSNRTVPVAAVMAAVLIADHVAQRHGRSAVSRFEKVVVTGLIIGCLTTLGFMVPHTASSAVHVDNDARASVDRLAPGTPLLNEWSNGGADMWHHPHLDIVMHGYGDMFTDAELERNARLLRLDPGWTEALDSLGSTEALLDVDGRLAHALEELLGWEVVAKDGPLIHLRAPHDGE